jgi:predicted RNase H-like nuclease (RuvC/YqgF family)
MFEVLQGYATFAGVLVALATAIYGLWRQRQDIRALKDKETKADAAAVTAAGNERERLRAEIEADWLTAMRAEMQSMERRIESLQKRIEALNAENAELRQRLTMEVSARDNRIRELELRVAHLEAENAALLGGGK